MCGADYQQGQKEQRTYGSPPHVRGGYTGIYRRYNRTRFTPACAGRITASAMRLPCSPVHPRMCGADFDMAHEKLYEVGSPPHVRGGYQDYPPAGGGGRFTPACAGRILIWPTKSSTRSVPPRMCGADTKIILLLVGAEGSPPHVRGGFCTAVSSVIAIRFTPACAGRIYAQEGRTLTLLVHTGMWGGDIGIKLLPWQQWGSPPHVRGGYLQPQVWGPAVRFTPACAGRIEEGAATCLHPQVRSEEE